MQNDEQKIVALEARIAALEKQVAYLTERDNAACAAELALADGGAI